MVVQPRNKNTKTFTNPKIPSDDHIRFSFRYLDIEHRKFSISDKNSEYFKKVLQRLKEMGAFTIKELIHNNSPSLRFHPIKWHESSEKKGFIHLDEQVIGGQPAYQLTVSANKYGRIHGFFVQYTFYIVWFDPEHKLFPWT